MKKQIIKEMTLLTKRIISCYNVYLATTFSPFLYRNRGYEEADDGRSARPVDGQSGHDAGGVGLVVAGARELIGL